MTGFSIKFKKIILITGDVLILYFSLWLAIFIRRGLNIEAGEWQQHLLPFSLIYIIWLLVFFISGYYELNSAATRLSFYSNIIQTATINLISAIILLYLIANRFTTVRPQTILILDIIIFTILFSAWRLLFNHFAKAEAWANRIAIIGLNKKTLEIIKEIKNKPQLGYRIVMAIKSPADEPATTLESVDIITINNSLDQEITKRKINTIISTVDLGNYPNLINEVFTCLSLGINFFDYANFYEKYTGKIPVTTIGQAWFLENLTENDKRLYERLKRMIDIVASVLIGLIALPFIPFIALAIKIDTRGPVMFKQNRVSKNGQIFLTLKFRSMRVGAEQDGPQWAQSNDSRTTRIGKFLRKTRIDEIPQLINVITGDMSLIGPRPERPEFVQTLEKEIPFYRERLLIKPGLTGWAQINFPYGASTQDALEKLQYDLYYIKNRSLILDLSILLKTVRIVLSRQGM